MKEEEIDSRFPRKELLLCRNRKLIPLHSQYQPPPCLIHPSQRQKSITKYHEKNVFLFPFGKWWLKGYIYNLKSISSWSMKEEKLDRVNKLIDKHISILYTFYQLKAWPTKECSFFAPSSSHDEWDPPNGPIRYSLYIHCVTLDIGFIVDFRENQISA